MSDGAPRLVGRPGLFRRDGASVFFTATELGADGREMLGRNLGLWSVPADGSGKPNRLTDAESIHLVRGGALAATPDGVLARAENRGSVELLLIAGKSDEPERLLSGSHQVEGMAHSDSVVVAVVASPASAGELIALAGGSERQLTSFAAISSPRPLEEITATSPDGYPVHGWIVRPEGPGPHPVLLMIHGGPFAQYGWRLFDEAQVYTGAGYAVVMGNPRGSSGYGQTHGTSIIGDAAANPAADLLALLDAAIATGGLDSISRGRPRRFLRRLHDHVVRGPPRRSLQGRRQRARGQRDRQLRRIQRHRLVLRRCAVGYRRCGLARPESAELRRPDRHSDS